jgi:hypothetical protein
MSTENQSTAATSAKTSREQEAGALWLKKSKAGNSFLSGYFLNESKEKVNVVVFKNNFKKAGEASPDYRIYLSENKNQGVPQSASSPASTNVEEADSADEIPF